MRNLRLLTFMMIMLASMMVLFAISMPQKTVAQDIDVGTPPVVITLGAPYQGSGVTDSSGAVVVSPTDCFAPFPLLQGDMIFIEPGVNIRSAPNFSSPIVWNTSNQQVDEDGNPLPIEEEFNVNAFVVEGPVCSNGYNWWRVNVSGGNDGWVAEGRPTDRGGYLILLEEGIEERTDCTPDFTFEVGEVALVTQNVRVRAEPNRDALVKTVVPAGTSVVVLAGPQCNPRDSIKWFQIRVEVVDFVYTGWIAQGSGGAIWLIPTDLPSEEAGTLCGAPLDFDIGTLGYVNSFDSRSRYLRDAPGLNSRVLFLLIDGVPFQFIGGPVCANNLNYWQIRVLSNDIPAEGWIAEGSQGVGYWLSPTDPDEYER